MAKAKYKFGQLLKSGTTQGTVVEIRSTETAVTYVLDNDEQLAEDAVDAVFRAVVPRAKKIAAAPRSKKKKSHEDRAAA